MQQNFNLIDELPCTISCSSYKSGHHSQQILVYPRPFDDKGSLDSSSSLASYFWQSESACLPHRIDLYFRKAILLESIHLNMLKEIDDTYTPSTLIVQAGSYSGDLIDIQKYFIDYENDQIRSDNEKNLQGTILSPDINGWVKLEFSSQFIASYNCIKCSCLSIVITENAGNGRDSRIRGIKVIGKKHEIYSK